MQLGFSTGVLMGSALTAAAALGAGVTYVAVTSGSAPGASDTENRDGVHASDDADDANPEESPRASSGDDAHDTATLDRNSPVPFDRNSQQGFVVEIVGDDVSDEASENGSLGESVSDRLVDLERRYLALLARQEAILLAEETAGRDTAGPSLTHEEDQADQVDPREGEASKLASLGSTSHGSTSRGSTPSGRNTAGDDGENFEDDPLAPEEAAPVVVHNNYVTVAQGPVYVVHPTDRSDRKSRRDAEEKRKKRISTYDDLGLQRAVLQPTNTSNNFFGSRGTSPWAPVQPHSRRHDPWAVTPAP